MKLGHLPDMLLKLQAQAKKQGFSDREIGNLEIVRIKNGMQVKHDFTIEFAKVEGKGFVALIEDKSGTGLSMVD